MKNIFNEAERNEILQRIEKLTPETQPLWGKMNVTQMLAHCTLAAQMPTEEVKPKSVGFPISILGSMLKTRILNATEFRKNSPTSPELKVAEPKEFQQEKVNFISAIKKLSEGGEKVATAAKHPFFGKMTAKEWGRINYVHADHHLKQFGV